ncbi:hypothetical protein BDN67DRAFT_917616, partial [Paxillus ammoniavirescens]
ITFIIGAMAASELKKPVTKWVSKSASFEFRLGDEPWDTLKARILAKISHLLSLDKIDFNDYEISFYIPHVLPKPGLPLSCEDHFKTLSSQVEKMSSHTPTINIIVQQNAVLIAVDATKENKADHGGDNETGGSKAANGKSQKKKNPAELPGNIKISKNIQLLRDTWTCQKPDSACPSSHCYVTPAGEHFSCWAAAMLKGIEHTTLAKPPNQRLFDAVNQHGNIAREKLSPVLQHHLNNLESKSSPNSSAPVINLTLGNDILGFAAPWLPQHTNRTDVASDVLLPNTCAPGDKIPIMEFCAHYNLSDGVLKKLQENSFQKVRSLRFVSISDLKDMRFNHGEIADLWDAVKQWSKLIPNT